MAIVVIAIYLGATAFFLLGIYGLLTVIGQIGEQPETWEDTVRKVHATRMAHSIQQAELDYDLAQQNIDRFYDYAEYRTRQLGGR